MTTPDAPGPEAPSSELPPPPAEGPEAPPPRLQPYLKILRRIVRSIRGVFQAHVIVIRTEAESELIRVAGGVALIFGTMVLMLCSALLAGAGTVALVQRLSGLPWLESIGISLGITLAVACLLAFVAWLRLRKPLMPESRKLLNDTFDTLTRG